jgi:hypothetical protein
MDLKYNNNCDTCGDTFLTRDAFAKTCTLCEMENTINKLEAFSVENTKHNWFEKLPLHLRLLIYFVSGFLIGLIF